MGMFDEIIFHDMVDFGVEVPPILPGITYQTKHFDQQLRTFHVNGGVIETSNVRGYQNRLMDCSDVLSSTFMRFYAGTSSLDVESILEASVSGATEKEISKALFFADLFSHSWLEYDVDLYCGKITQINAIYTGYCSRTGWTRDGFCQ